jgi:hypothetical protein
VVNGIADPILLDKFYDASFPDVPGAMQSGAAGEEVKRVQRRLYDLEYLYTSADGRLRPRHGQRDQGFPEAQQLSQSGEADKKTWRSCFPDSAKKALKPYMLKVSTAKQRVYAYAPDENEEYTILVRTMKCSTGLNATPTPRAPTRPPPAPAPGGTTSRSSLSGPSTPTISRGHHVPLGALQQQGGSPTSGSVRNLGRKASHGCVRLSVENAKWIYQTAGQDENRRLLEGNGGGAPAKAGARFRSLQAWRIAHFRPRD